MKILDICPMFPWPIKSGGDQAVFNMINALQDKIEIHFLFPTNPIETKSYFKFKNPWENVILHPFAKKKSIKFIMSRLCIIYNNKYNMQGKGFKWLQAASQYFTSDFINFIEKTIIDIQPDIIQTEFYNYQDLVFALPQGVKKVFIQHEIHYIVNSQRLKSFIKLDAYKKFAYNKLKSEEITAMNNYDAIFTLTENDRKELLRNGITKPVYCSPAGIAPPYQRNKCHYDNKLIFVGGSMHTPNKMGIEWFLRNVWELVLSEEENIQLNIVGKWEKGLITQIKSKFSNVTFKGYVSSLKKEYDGAIAIVPILQGSGMRMKIIDAVNFGSPFVSTSIGSEGLDFKNGVDCFIADTPQLFASRLLYLIKNEKLRQLFYNQSLSTLNRFYSMHTLANKRLELYNKIIIGHSW